MRIKKDPTFAFMPYPDVRVQNAPNGPLAGLTFAVKDLFDVEGYPTSCGCPLKLAESSPAPKNAPIVQTLLDAGAEFKGKTKTDELAWSLEGINQHFGTPINPTAPDRVPGGSSSGSASATSAGTVDFAIGTDTGGSIRLPASFCGIWGIRPTHGRLPLQSCMELAKSFDTAGLFAKDGATFERVANVLYSDQDVIELTNSQSNFILAPDMFELAEPECSTILKSKIPYNVNKLKQIHPIGENADPLYLTFRVLQAREVMQSLGQWVRENNPPLTPGVQERFIFAKGLDEKVEATSNEIRKKHSEPMHMLLNTGKILVVPSTIAEAPLLVTSKPDWDTFRKNSITLLCIAGLSGVPQISIPVATGPNNAPIGLSLIGPRGSDLSLIKVARSLFPNL